MEPTRRAVLLGLAAIATVGAAAEAAPPAPAKPPPLKIRGRSSSLVLRDRFGGGDIRQALPKPETFGPTKVGDRIQVHYASGRDEVYEVVAVSGGQVETRMILPRPEDLVTFDDYVGATCFGDPDRIQVAQVIHRATSASGPSRRAVPIRPRYTWPSPKRSRRR